MGKIDYERSSHVLKALAHPIRIKILEVLLDNEYCVNDVSRHLVLLNLYLLIILQYLKIAELFILISKVPEHTIL